MSSYSGQRDLRRRPVRPDVPQEVEISEIQEDAGQQEREDESYDDPLVLKGSRLTGAPKEPLEGEDDWGIDDDDNWGSKMDPSHPRKETQEQRIRRVMHRGNMEVAIAFLLHLALLGFYVYVHIYDGTIFKRTKGKGFLGHNKFGGRWKFLTYIDLWVQFVYFFLSLLCDIMPSSYAKLLLAKFCDFVFATVTFPLAIFVAIAFWGIYAVDRELVFPAALDEYIPQLLNHFWHTTVVIGVILEIFLVFHRYPKTSNAVTMTFAYSTGYIVWIVAVVTVADIWVYPFLKVMPPPVISVFFAACFFVVLGLYFLGKMIAYWRWQERHLLIEELRL